MVAARKNLALTGARLRELLDYDPETGIFRWRPKRAGSLNLNTGYRTISVDGVDYAEHRLAVFFMTGEWPDGDVDHDNRRRDDNRWENLIDGTKSQNQHNTGLRSTNRSGVKGVFYDGAIYRNGRAARHARKKPWRAVIRINGVRSELGRFATLEEAEAAYEAARPKR